MVFVEGPSCARTSVGVKWRWILSLNVPYIKTFSDGVHDVIVQWYCTGLTVVKCCVTEMWVVWFIMYILTCFKCESSGSYFAEFIIIKFPERITWLLNPAIVLPGPIVMLPWPIVRFPCHYVNHCGPSSYLGILCHQAVVLLYPGLVLIVLESCCTSRFIVCLPWYFMFIRTSDNFFTMYKIIITALYFLNITSIVLSNFSFSSIKFPHIYEILILDIKVQFSSENLWEENDWTALQLNIYVNSTVPL